MKRLKIRRRLLGRELRRGELIDLFPGSFVTAVEDSSAWLLYPSKEYLPKKVRVLVDFLTEKFRDELLGDRD